MQRERFQSRLGFILVSAGCAVGIGNVWRFPYVAGTNSGGIFVLCYLVFLAVLGVPVLTMELAVGRASRRNAVQAYRALEPRGSKWHVHGWFCLLGCLLLMMYYTTVAGWMLGYFFRFAGGSFAGMAPDAVSAVFRDLQQRPGEMTLWMVVIVVSGFLVCSLGLQKGLERISKFMMTALLLLIVVLAVNSILLPGSAEGLRFYLLPDLGRAMEVGLGNVVMAAMNQAFFTLSLGIAAMEVFGSYMTREQTLAGEAVRICLLDTFVALMAGLIIFPACSAFQVAPNTGPSLIFETLPNLFAHMAGGRLWGALFFLFMTFASFTTIIAVFENLLSSAMDNFGWSRKASAGIHLVVVFLLSLPCVLGYNLWSGVTLLGRNIMYFEDFLVSNILLPCGSLVYLLFCVSRWGWGFDRYLAEANTGRGLRISPRLRRCFQFVLPALILAILIQGLL